jgi:hypothetical protein
VSEWVCVGLVLCTTLSSSINTMIRSSPACSRKKKPQNHWWGDFRV